MFDNSFWGSANIGGYQITIGQPNVYYPPMAGAPIYYPTPVQTAGFGALDSTGVMLIVLIGVLIVLS